MGRRSMRSNIFRIAQNTQNWWGYTLERGDCFGLYRPDPKSRGICYVSKGELNCENNNCIVAYKQGERTEDPQVYQWEPVSIPVECDLGKLILDALNEPSYERERRNMKSNKFKIAETQRDWWGFTLQPGHCYGLYKPNPDLPGTCYVFGGECDSGTKDHIIVYKQTDVTDDPRVYNWEPVSVHIKSPLGMLIRAQILNSTYYQTADMAFLQEVINQAMRPRSLAMKGVRNKSNKIVCEDFVRLCCGRVSELEIRLKKIRNHLSNLEAVKSEDTESEEYEEWKERWLELDTQIFNVEADISETEGIIEMELHQRYN